MPSIKLIGVDFDQTLCDTIPYWFVGTPVPGAATWIDQWRHAGAKVYLHSTRFWLTRWIAADWCKRNGIILDEYDHPWWWIAGSKPPYGKIVDDKNEGCPLIYRPDKLPIVDFAIVGPDVLKWIKS